MSDLQEQKVGRCRRHFFVRVREQIEVPMGSMIFNRFLANINV